MASVHPCKHASVMKKVIERMGASAGAEQQRALASEGGASAGAVNAAVTPGKEKKGRKWLGLRKTSGSKEASTPGEEEDGGLQVDYYLVIVSLRPRHEFVVGD